MVFVARGVTCPSVLVITEGRVVLVGAVVAHILLDALPFLDGKTVGAVALVVPLGSTEGSQRELMVVVEALGDTGKPVVAFELGALDVAVTPSLAAQQGESPPVLGQTGRNGEKKFVVSVVTHSVRYGTSFLGISTHRDDVDRAANRRRGHLGGTQSALHLHSAGHVGQSCPVGPIDFLVLHAVHGHAVDHHGYIVRVEAAHAGLGIAIAAAVFGDVNTGSGLQYFREFLRAQLLVNEDGLHIGHGHRCLAVDGDTGGDDHIVQQHSIRLHADDA